MASTYTPDLRFNQQGIGDNNNTWGTVLNTQLALIDNAISGIVTLDVTTGLDITLSTANGTTDQARNMIIKLSGTPINDINIIVPALSKVYIINANLLAGAFTVTIKPTAGTGVAFSAGECGVVACDGTNVEEVAKKLDPAPTGDIRTYYGSIATALTVYPGYIFCDGTNGTPDLRDKFVVGARQDSTGVAMTNITGTLTQSGGSTTTTAAGAVSAGVTGDTVLDITQIPSHTHGLSYHLGAGGNGSSSSALVNGGGSGFVTDSAGSNASHNHTTPAISDHVHTATPPYFALVFLMKT